jgi:hypothetical protein
VNGIGRARVFAFSVLVLFAGIALASVLLEWDFREGNFAEEAETRRVNLTHSGWAERSSAYGRAFGMYNSSRATLAEEANRGTMIKVTFFDGSSVGLVVTTKMNPYAGLAEIPGSAKDKDGNPITPKERLTGELSVEEAAEWLRKFTEQVNGSDEGGFGSRLIDAIFGGAGGGNNPYANCFVVTPPLSQTVTYGPNGEVIVTGHVPVATLECPMS